MAESGTHVAKLYPAATEAAAPLVIQPPPTEASVSQWHVATTHARHEKRVQQQLLSRGVECFLPLYASLRQWHDRKKQLQLPVFPGYVFVRISYVDRLRVLQLPGVASLVTFGGKPATLPDDQMERLRIALSLRASRPHPYVSAGTRVRIVSGPLRGLAGIVQRERRPRLIVSVDCLCRSVAVELDESDLLPVAGEGK